MNTQTPAEYVASHEITLQLKRMGAKDLTRSRSASSRVTSASPQPIADLVEPRVSAAVLELDPGRGGGAVIKNKMPVQVRA